jgi:hypothetical protein
MWTIWHIAYMANVSMFTLAPQLSRLLVAPHGSEASEHGNADGRLPMASVRLFEDDGRGASSTSEALIQDCAELQLCCGNASLTRYDFDLRPMS